MSDNLPLHLVIRRDAHLFATRPELMERMQKQHTMIPLATDQLLHPTEVGDVIVRRGKLRVSQFIAGGREVTRAVLQAGSVLLIRAAGDLAADSADDRYLVDELVLMALGEVELWALPADALEQAE